MHKLAWVGIGFLLCLSAGAKPGDLKKDCYHFDTPVPWAFCSFKTEGSRNPDLLYHMHGKGSKEDAWNDEKPGDLPFYPALIRERWKQMGFEAPTVVTVDFALPPQVPAWLLVEKNASPLSGLFEVMVDQVMPTVEKTLGGLRGRRMIIGESMGGFNAAELVLKAGARFTRAAVLCPPMTSLTPQATPAEVAAYIQRTHADPQRVQGSLLIAQAYVPQPDDWAHASPLILAQHLPEHLPRLYLSCGSYDEYGFFEGTDAFVHLLKSQGVRFPWHPLYGGHCAVDAVSVARFLAW